MRGHVEDQDLVLSLDGELSPRRQSLVVRHLDACAVCRTHADRIQLALSRINGRPAEDSDSLPGSFERGRVRLERALRNAEFAPQPWWTAVVPDFSFEGLLRTLAVGAVVVAFAAALLVRPVDHSGAGALAEGTLPDPSLTPGAVSQLTTAELCNGVRPPRLVTEGVRRQVVRAYGMERVSEPSYELDALITPELGGSTDAANLWPQRYQSPLWNARVKDELERLLPELVCRHEITLAQAQRAIASDWIAAYKRYFKTDVPLSAHLAGPGDDEAELVFVPDRSAPPQLVSFRVVGR